MSDEKKTTLYNSINCGEQIQNRFKGVELILSCGDLDMGYIDLFICCLGVPFYYVFGNHSHLYWGWFLCRYSKED